MLKSDRFDPLEEAYEGGTPLRQQAAASGSTTNKSWANTMPGRCGLYEPDYEKDACGVGFVANIKGTPSHKIVADARFLLCNMTHRGAVSSGGNGDGAGILVGIPHEFMKREFMLDLGVEVPSSGEYAVGNVFFKRDQEPEQLQQAKDVFEEMADSLDLKVLGWRNVPRDSTIIG